MYSKNLFLFVAAGASTVSAGAAFAERAVQGRDSSSGGWSLQSTSAVDGLTSCGSDAYCPSSMTCIAASQAVAAACCPSDDSNCIGAIEGSPRCADASWTLYKNNQGNGFCCAAGQVGAFDSSAKTGAGVCADSVSGSYSSAYLVSSGTGSASTSAASSAAATSAAASTTVESSAAESTPSASASDVSSPAASSTGSAPTASGASTSVAASTTSSKPSSTKSGSASATSGSTATKSGNSSSASSSASATSTITPSNGAIQNGAASAFTLLFGGLALALTL